MNQGFDRDVPLGELNNTFNRKSEEEPALPEWAACISQTDSYEFGCTIGWLRPAKLWKPFVELNVWNWRIQLGWLY